VVIALVIGYFFFGESFSLWSLVGMGSILAAVVLGR
jgi:multidrug transporter EmrE-like cation transporter